MSTLEEIASRVGLSAATVSRALNDKPGVSQETRQRIIDLAREMDYTPNLAGRALVTATTHTIGFLGIDAPLPFSADPFYFHVMRGAEEELVRKGYFVILSTLSPESLPTGSELMLLREKRVDGLIIPGPYFPPKFILSLKQSGIPLVLVDNRLEQTPVDCVLVGDEEAAAEATRHLIAHGHQNIVALSGSNEWVSNRARVRGYRQVMAAAGLQPAVFTTNPTTHETGYAAMQAALQEKTGLTAVFAINDAMATGAIRAANEQGLSVPGDIAVVGFDDVDLAAIYQPSLTTMRVRKRELGILAARRLMDILSAGDSYTVTSMVGADLVIRRSCGC